MKHQAWPGLLVVVTSVAVLGCDGTLNEHSDIAKSHEALIPVGDHCNRPSDCPTGKSCILNHCVAQPGGMGLCFNDQDCGLRQKCIGKICVTEQVSPDDPIGCSSNADCASWQQCDNRSCRAKPGRCVSPAQCGRGYVCRNTYCAKGPSYCDRSSDCRAEQACNRNLCEPKACLSNAACPVSFFCQFPRSLSTGCGKTAGQCTSLPAGCEAIDTTGYSSSAPIKSPSVVRGCDDKYYTSATAAHCNGVSVKFLVGCHSCNAGERSCRRGDAYRCETGANGCRVWKLKEQCGDYCDNGRCGACHHTCSFAGQKTCTPDDNLKECEEDEHGCRTLTWKKECKYECINGGCQSSPTEYQKTLNFTRSSSNDSIGYNDATFSEGYCAARSRAERTTSIKNTNNLAVALTFEAVTNWFAPGVSLSYTNLQAAGDWSIYPYGCTMDGANKCPISLSMKFTYRCER